MGKGATGAGGGIVRPHQSNPPHGRFRLMIAIPPCDDCLPVRRWISWDDLPPAARIQPAERPQKAETGNSSVNTV
jgi:hypothetical protein